MPTALPKTKKCSKCGEVKAVAGFSKNKVNKDGLCYWCKKCQAEYRAKPEVKKRMAGYGAEWGHKWYTKPENKKRVSERDLKRKYGITQEQWDKMFADQNYCCASCQNNVSNGKGWVVDHSHKTGKVRGILCDSCNKMLGHAKDSPPILQLGAAYLEKSEP